MLLAIILQLRFKRKIFENKSHIQEQYGKKYTQFNLWLLGDVLPFYFNLNLVSFGIRKIKFEIFYIKQYTYLITKHKYEGRSYY